MVVDTNVQKIAIKMEYVVKDVVIVMRDLMVNVVMKSLKPSHVDAVIQTAAEMDNVLVVINVDAKMDGKENVVILQFQVNVVRVVDVELTEFVNVHQLTCVRVIVNQNGLVHAVKHQKM